jgi:hypothetical protein
MYANEMKIHGAVPEDWVYITDYMKKKGINISGKVRKNGVVGKAKRKKK